MCLYVDWNQSVFLAQMMSFVVRYDVIYHFFPINSQYSRTSLYGHLYITDSFQCPDKISYIFFKKTSIVWTVSNTDNGH